MPNRSRSWAPDKARDLFSKYGVLSEAELEARLMVLYETYAQVMQIEARTLLRMVNTMVIPAAIRHQAEVAEAIAATDAAGVDPAAVRGRLTDLTARITDLEVACLEVESILDNLPEDDEETTRKIQDKMIPAMNKARLNSDAIESILPDDLWPLPTYLDLLF